MIELAVVDLSADSRRVLSALVEKWSWVGPDRRVSLPRLSINLVAPEEVRFHGSIDVCVVGPELLACDAAYVTTLRAQLPGKAILCVLDAETYSFGMIEQLGRLGVDDVLLDSASSDEFFRRLLLLQRRVGNKAKGRLLLVSSARGGVGVTFTAAALAEGLAEQGRTACLVDCDVFSQDLTRFLQVRPFVNEPLKLLIDQQRVITGETIAECIRPVWDEGDVLVSLVPPPVGLDTSLFASPLANRALGAVLDALLGRFDVVVVDGSALLHSTRQALLPIVDECIFVMNRDPAGAYANRQALTLLAGALPLESSLRVVINHTGGLAAPLPLLEREVTCVPGRSFEIVRVPHSPRAARWPCSGRTPYHELRRCYGPLVNQPAEKREGVVRAALARLRVWLSAKRRRVSHVLHGDGRRCAGAADAGVATAWRAAPMLGAATRESSSAALHDESLVSKPVLLEQPHGICRAISVNTL